MTPLLVKIFATALALSQLTSAPETVQTEFDRDRDQAQVAQLLRDGCSHLRKVFDIEDINIDSLITTAMDDPQVVAGSTAFRNVKLGDLHAGYREFCQREQVDQSPIDLGEVIDFYNKALAALPDEANLKRMQRSGISTILDRDGEPFTEISQDGRSWAWVPLADIPDHVRKSFIAAEDRRFYQHKGIDERGLIRAFIANIGQTGRPQGGSTITQQVVKNLLVGDDLSYDRKIAEMIVASRVEKAFSKDEILELYLNTIFLGRGAWGIELAAQRYFGKSANALSLEEGALLAGLTKGPNYFNPSRYPDRAKERLAYVLSRVQEEGSLGQADTQPPDEGRRLPPMVVDNRTRPDSGYHFADQVMREARSTANVRDLATGAYTVRSTIDQRLQRAVEASLQEGLARYEQGAGRVRFRGAEMNLAAAIERINSVTIRTDSRPSWRQALASVRLPLYDVHWTPAVVLERKGGKKGEGWDVGLSDGRVLALATDRATARKLGPYDVVMVRINETRGNSAQRAELRARPEVQGMVLVLENKTGRILAMSGGFSYPLSQLNRATQAMRQPGSAIKPLSYLAALGTGLQPNTLISDEPITLPPLGRARADDQDWSPTNYGRDGGGALTLRQALEKSRNQATAHLFYAIKDTPEASLNRLCELAAEAQVYQDCLHFYSIILGAQPVRPVDLAAFYAAIANEGERPSPFAVDTIERNGEIIYRHEPRLTRINSVDRVAFYQLKTMMQGVLAYGTAKSIASLAPYVAGKTGTSDDENDAWFVGFTNDVTVAVWIGYDNATGKRRTLGSGSTGGGVAVPIFESVMRAVWARTPKVALAPPSGEATQQLACKAPRGGTGIAECFRLNGKGKIVDTQYRLVARDGANKHVQTSRYGVGRGDDWNRDPWQATQSGNSWQTRTDTANDPYADRTRVW